MVLQAWRVLRPSCTTQVCCTVCWWHMPWYKHWCSLLCCAASFSDGESHSVFLHGKTISAQHMGGNTRLCSGLQAYSSINVRPHHSIHDSICLLCNAWSADLYLHLACVEPFAVVKKSLMLRGIVRPHRQREAVVPMLVGVMQVI